MSDRIDTAKEREKLALIAINEFEGAFCSCDGHRIHEDTCDFIMVREIFRNTERLLDALDAKDAENERLREAAAAVEEWWLRDGMQNSLGGAPVAIFQLRSALNPGGEHE